ncbi:MAG TPA: GNAT family N-acetyltransferase [Solirubrobacteraceae bacterium]|nr:GNAT family N-acetyltransferase [Solirubrobacteraceae bacterium]
MEGSVSTDHRRPAAQSPARPAAAQRQPAAGPGATIRLARVEDAAAVAGAVRELLLELSGQAPPPQALERVARAVIDDPGAGAVLVAAEEERIVGVLTASWQLAIHVPGRYALIQDLWVARERRSAAIGRALLLALFDLALEREIVRVEVGLPSERFAGLAATARFYESNGFSQLGPRMRQMLL